MVMFPEMKDLKAYKIEIFGLSNSTHDFNFTFDSEFFSQFENSLVSKGSDKCFSVIQTKDGGYFATGFLDVNESGGQGNDNRAHSLGDYWGIKMDANGDRIWRRYFGGSHVDESKDVLQTSDDGFLLIGYSESSDFDITDARGANDMWIVKVSPFGDLQWQKSFGGSEIDFGYGVPILLMVISLSLEIHEVQTRMFQLLMEMPISGQSNSMEIMAV